MTAKGAGTTYRVVVRHASAKARHQHDAMGFQNG